MGFEPKILSFLCNWCAYAGADLAGISRFQYPPTTRVIRVMCSGRIDPAFVPRGLLAGFDGVMILGCHPGDCHYLSGNIQAQRKMDLVHRLMEEEGIGKDRLLLDWVSAGEGQRFAGLVRAFTETLKGLGPLRLGDEIRLRLRAVQAALEGEKLRWLAGKVPELLEKENVYGERLPKERLDQVLQTACSEELWRALIMLILEGGPLTAHEISERLALPLPQTLPHLTALVGEGRVGLEAGHEERRVRYVRAG